jgi:benzoylformate decarboxylase
MYSIQALWTAAHHDIAVLFLILDNREYRILKHNLDAYRQRFGVRTERGYAHMDLSKPELSFVEIAHGMGVPASRVARADELAPALAVAVSSGGPYLLDIVVEGRR